MSKPERYPTLIDEVQQLVNFPRPDIAKTVSALGSFSKRPTVQYWGAE